MKSNIFQYLTFFLQLVLNRQVERKHHFISKIKVKAVKFNQATDQRNVPFCRTQDATELLHEDLVLVRKNILALCAI